MRTPCRDNGSTLSGEYPLIVQIVLRYTNIVWQFMKIKKPTWNAIFRYSLSIDSKLRKRPIAYIAHLRNSSIKKHICAKLLFYHIMKRNKNHYLLLKNLMVLYSLNLEFS